MTHAYPSGTDAYTAAQLMQMSGTWAGRAEAHLPDLAGASDTDRLIAVRLANTYATLAHAAAIREAAEELGSRLATVTASIDALRDGVTRGGEGGTP
jgi:hypothetical protein